MLYLEAIEPYPLSRRIYGTRANNSSWKLVGKYPVLSSPASSLFVSERSRLAVVTPAKDTRLLASHLVQHLSVLLDHLKVKPEWIDAEIQQMVDVRYAATKSRSVLGTMNDYKFQIETRLAESLEVSEIEIALHLSVCPVGPLQYRSPDKVTIDLLKKNYGMEK